MSKELEENHLISVYIPSFGLETWPIKEQNKTRHFIKGSLNGIPFEVECDRQVEIPQSIADILRPLIEKQTGLNR